MYDPTLPIDPHDAPECHYGGETVVVEPVYYRACEACGDYTTNDAHLCAKCQPETVIIPTSDTPTGVHYPRALVETIDAILDEYAEDPLCPRCGDPAGALFPDVCMFCLHEVDDDDPGDYDPTPPDTWGNRGGGTYRAPEPRYGQCRLCHVQLTPENTGHYYSGSVRAWMDVCDACNEVEREIETERERAVWSRMDEGYQKQQYFARA